jgi:hypothetical protein
LSGKHETSNGGNTKSTKISSGGGDHFRHKSAIGSIDCY